RFTVEPIEPLLAAGGELRERYEVARVALERIRRQTPFDAQMIQILVDKQNAMIVSAARPIMPARSKWQSLPTEQINPATLAIDKLPAADIVEGMLNEDRKMLAAVQREKERIAVGIDIITQALRKNGRIIFVGAG